MDIGESDSEAPSDELRRLTTPPEFPYETVLAPLGGKNRILLLQRSWSGDIPAVLDLFHQSMVPIEYHRLCILKELNDYYLTSAWSRDWTRMQWILAIAERHGFFVELIYRNRNEEWSERVVGDISFSDAFEDIVPRPNFYFEGYCFLRKERRTFRVSRIQVIRLVAMTKAEYERKVFPFTESSNVHV